jgi:hypothetical protein
MSKCNSAGGHAARLQEGTSSPSGDSSNPVGPIWRGQSEENTQQDGGNSEEESSVDDDVSSAFGDASTDRGLAALFRNDSSNPVGPTWGGQSEENTEQDGGNSEVESPVHDDASSAFGDASTDRGLAALFRNNARNAIVNHVQRDLTHIGVAINDGEAAVAPLPALEIGDSVFFRNTSSVAIVIGLADENSLFTLEWQGFRSWRTFPARRDELQRTQDVDNTPRLSPNSPNRRKRNRT